MKKLFLVVICLLVVTICSSCTNKFDRTDTENIYAQIILSDNRKINLKLYYDKAPITVDNFINLVEDKYYNNTVFHRVIEGFMIQGGGYVKKGDDYKVKGDPETIKGEFSSNGWKKNNIKHVEGVISMARATNKNSASSQFFICSASNSSVSNLDGDYAAFGKTSDQKSKQIVIDISKVETYEHSNIFTDMPVKVVKIKTIKLSNTKFEAE